MRLTKLFFKRSLLFLVVIVSATGFALWWQIPDQNNTLPMRRILASSLLQPEDADQQPILVLLNDDVDKIRNPRLRKVELAFVNPTNVPVAYSGYTPESFDPRTPRGEINPLYKIEVENESEWIAKDIGWCGFGLARLSVQPGHAGRFYVYLPRDGTTARLGIRCTWVANDGTENKALVWSQELGPSHP